MGGGGKDDRKQNTCPFGLFRHTIRPSFAQILYTLFAQLYSHPNIFRKKFISDTEPDSDDNLVFYLYFKGTVSRVFLLLVFFMNQFPPSPRVSSYDRFDFFRGYIRKSRCTTGINDTGGNFAAGVCLIPFKAHPMKSPTTFPSEGKLSPPIVINIDKGGN